jgi:predicted nicotinamide N-methyase
MTTPAAPVLSTTIGDFPLSACRVRVGDLDLSVLHTDAVLSLDEETTFLNASGTKVPYGVVLWPGAVALTYDIVTRGPAFRGRTVLELGAGTGLPGLAAAALGAKVVQTDRSELIVHVCEQNVARNKLAGVECRIADWSDWHDTARYDWIIGSDILYADTQHDNLRRIFAGNLAPGGRVLLSDPFRPPSVALLERMQAAGWSVAHSRWKIGEGTAARAVAVYELTPPANAARQA